jgi:hypothetical protein
MADYSGTFQNSSSRDEIIELRAKLLEAYEKNEELKSSFNQSIIVLKETLKECMEDKESLIEKKYTIN